MKSKFLINFYRKIEFIIAFFINMDNPYKIFQLMKKQFIGLDQMNALLRDHIKILKIPLFRIQ